VAGHLTPVFRSTISESGEPEIADGPDRFGRERQILRYPAGADSKLGDGDLRIPPDLKLQCFS
jgi:hypothetical protein